MKQKAKIKSAKTRNAAACGALGTKLKNMGTLSSSTLFHFTSNAENLLSILKNEFYPRFCPEKICIGDKFYEEAFPMVCFCDIPLSQVKNHMDTYGVYGIGLTADWAIQKGLNPVHYIKENSFFMNNFSQAFKSFSKINNQNDKTLEQIRVAFANIIRYLKPYEGDFLKGKVSSNKIKFYDEREWRYTPPWEERKEFSLEKIDYENSITIANANEKMKIHKLEFIPQDIKYIIVKDENEIFPMITAMKEIKDKYDKRTLEILTSRIITSEQILFDF